MVNIDSTLRQRLSHKPIVTFLFVLILYSGLAVAVLYAVFGANFPGLAALPYAWAPMVSAGVTVWLCGESVRDWLGQLRNLRTGLHWYLIGVGIMMIGTEFENIVMVLLGADAVVPYASVGDYVFTFAVTLFLAGALEELGWRGFLQPRLQQRFSALHASMGIGIIWGLWHVPMILTGTGDFTVFWEYMLNITVMSVLLGWLYNNTNGALPVVMVAHASHNMPRVGEVTGDVPVVFNILSGDVIFYMICASLVGLYAGAQTLTRDGSLPEAPGQRRDQFPKQEGPAD